MMEEEHVSKATYYSRYVDIQQQNNVCTVYKSLCSVCICVHVHSIGVNSEVHSIS